MQAVMTQAEERNDLTEAMAPNQFLPSLDVFPKQVNMSNVITLFSSNFAYM